jgi:hypothetical protein
MKEGILIFEIEGKPNKVGFFKKQRSYIAVFYDAIVIEFNGEKDYYGRRDIFDIYIQEPVVEGVESRTTRIEFYEEGEQKNYALDDDTFPGLANKIEGILEKEWSHITKKRDYPETVKWFIACCSVVHIVSEQNPFIFGSAYKEPENISAQREELYENWGFNNKHDLLDMLPQLLDDRTIKQNQKNAKYGEFNADLERCFRAWDLQRLILLSALGYLCDYLSWEESLDWCLIAGKKLQGYFRSWDDFMNSYLLGYSIWSDEDLEDEDSEAYERKQVYEYYKKMLHSPWSVQWYLTLTKEW